MAKTVFHDHKYPGIPRSQRDHARWPQWPDIQDTLQAMGLAAPGHRLIESGFGEVTINIPRFGIATLKCEPQAPRIGLIKRRYGHSGAPHRLKMRCSCGEWIFFGKINQHYPSRRHAELSSRVIAL